MSIVSQLWHRILFLLHQFTSWREIVFVIIMMFGQFIEIEYLFYPPILYMKYKHIICVTICSVKSYISYTIR